ncbi:hypothetical protein [Flavobacterium sp.]|uniref:hypothetical protein n=1 Tax=Flavobacterium sp. TaxID=239 RepID=UPI0026197CDC|nr:hypothetical protein [Flavobacterium sp.]
MKKQPIYLALVLIGLLTANCSGDDTQTQVTTYDADNELYIYVENQSSISGTYLMNYNGNTIQNGFPVPIGGTVYKIINADLLTLVDFMTTEESLISFSLNNSIIHDFHLDAQSCYELTFTRDSNNEAKIGELIKVDCY